MRLSVALHIFSICPHPTAWGTSGGWKLPHAEQDARGPLISDLIIAASGMPSSIPAYLLQCFFPRCLSCLVLVDDGSSNFLLLFASSYLIGHVILRWVAYIITVEHFDTEQNERDRCCKESSPFAAKVTMMFKWSPIRSGPLDVGSRAKASIMSIHCWRARSARPLLACLDAQHPSHFPPYRLFPLLVAL
jgi:hypothetical protein